MGEARRCPPVAVKDGGAPGYDGSAAYVLAAGLSAAKLGDTATATVAVEKLKAMRTQAESGSNAYRAKPFAIMEKEVAAALAVAQKDTAGAEKLLKEATALELTLDAPSGRPIRSSRRSSSTASCSSISAACKKPRRSSSSRSSGCRTAASVQGLEDFAVTVVSGASATGVLRIADAELRISIADSSFAAALRSDESAIRIPRSAIHRRFHEATRAALIVAALGGSRASRRRRLAPRRC